MKSIQDTLDNIERVRKERNAAGEGSAQSDQSVEPVQQQLISLDELPDIARVERNFQRVSDQLFPAAQTRGLDTERRITLDDGAYLEVTPPAGKKSFTNRSYIVFAILCQMFLENPNPKGEVIGHYADILRRKRVNVSSGKNIESVEEDLRALADTTTYWRQSFMESDDTVSQSEKISIISRYSRKSYSNRNADSVFRIRFGEMITEGLLAGKTIPKNIAALVSISSSRGQVLYRNIDSKLAFLKDADTLRMRSDRVFTEILAIDIVNTDYAKRSRRKRLLERITGDLDGLPLSTGHLLTIFIEETKDQQDYNIVCRKESKEFVYTPGRIAPVNSSEKAESLALSIVDIVGENIPIGWAKRLALSYDENIIWRAIGRFKECRDDRNFKISKPGGFFTHLMHDAVHDAGANWFEDCGDACSHRAENRTNKLL